jgi:HEAT repeat protein
MVSGDRARLLDLAKGEKDPELRREAVRQLGAMGAQDELWTLYQADAPTEDRKNILRSLFVAGNATRLLEVARTDKDPELRRSAIQNLGVLGSKRGGEGLASIYESDKDASIRKAVIQALFVQGNAKALVDIGRKETDPELKKEIVSKLSVMRSKEATDFLMELLNK